MDDKVRDYKIRRIKRLVDKLNKDDADFEAKHKRDKDGKFAKYSDNTVKEEGKKKGVKSEPLKENPWEEMQDSYMSRWRGKKWGMPYDKMKDSNKEEGELLRKTHDAAKKKVEKPAKNSLLFRSQGDYDDFYCDNEYYYDNVNTVNILDDPKRNRIDIDGEFDCKSWKTAIKRFCAGIPDYIMSNLYSPEDWIDQIETRIDMKKRALKAKERGEYTYYDPDDDPFVDDWGNGGRLSVEFPNEDTCYISVILPRDLMQ